MKKFILAIVSAVAWVLGRMPTQGQSIRSEIDRLEREYDKIIQKKTSIANVRRLRNISDRLRVLYKQASNKAA
jgi:hypothetical protein